MGFSYNKNPKGKTYIIERYDHMLLEKLTITVNSTNDENSCDILDSAAPFGHKPRIHNCSGDKFFQS